MMRFAALFLLAATIALSGATCTFDTGPDGNVTPGTILTVTLDRPSSDRSVPQGAVVTIGWTAVNYSGGPALLEIYVENRESLVKTTLVEGLGVTNIVGPATLEWNTTDYDPSVYSIRARLVAGNRAAESTAPGRITVDGPPTFAFTAPTTDTSKQPNQNLTISWRGGDDEGTASVRIGLDPDLDHGSGNEFFIDERDLPEAEAAQTLEWDGKDVDDEDVPPDTYNLFALVEDGVNPLLTFEGLARISVPEPDEPNEDITLGIRKPDTNTEFLNGAAPLKIEFGVNINADVLIDLKIDTDDNHANGNEITILSQRLVEANTETDSYDWPGTDASGATVPDGIYKLLIVANRGTGSPQTAAGTAQVFRRDSASTPDSRQTWERQSGSGSPWALVEPDAAPSARTQTALAFDDERDISVLFGGALDGVANNETWVYNRTNWEQKTVAGPPALFGHALAFDDLRNVVLLFGGSDGTTAQDQTWTWDGSAWTQQSVSAPSARFSHALAFDRNRDMAVLFGGTDGTTRNAETWEWDGAAWSQRTPANSPSARQNASAAYDTIREEVVLFGGDTDTGLSDETWTWDGNDWTLRSPANKPSARRGHALAFDSDRGVVLLFGGSNGTVALADTWEWNGTDWSQLEPATSPPARFNHGLCYDTTGRRLVLFGGSSGIPVIALQEPASITTVDPGQFINIRWRDDDPTGRGQIRIVFDDDPNPAEGAETNQPEVEVLTGRLAAPDGVQDSFAWQVPGTVNPGTYYIFAYIDRDGSSPYDSRSIAPGRIIVRDPSGQ